MTEQPPPRLLLGAVASWLAMLAAVGLGFAVLEAFVPGGGDADIKVPGELTAMVLMFSLLPLLLISFGVLLPSFALIQRWTSGRTSRVARALWGGALSAPAFAAFVVINWMLQPRRGKTLTQDFSAIFHRPKQAIPVIAVFAIGGVVFAFTSLTKRTEPSGRMPFGFKWLTFVALLVVPMMRLG